MSIVSIQAATDIYSEASRCEIVRVGVHADVQATAARSLRSLIAAVGDEVDQDYWRLVLRPIKRILFLLASTPLPHTEIAQLPSIDVSGTEELVQRSRFLYPGQSSELSALWDRLKAILATSANALRPDIEAYVDGGKTTSVLLKDARMIPAVQAYFRTQPTLAALAPVVAGQLTGVRYCDRLLVLGPARWFPEHVFCAPRASQIILLSPTWIADNWSPSPCFVQTSRGESNGRSYHHGTLPKVVASSGRPVAVHMVLPEDLLPAQLSVGELVLRSIGAGGQPTDSDEISARACLLANQKAVFLEADDSSSVIAIDLSELGYARVHRTLVGDLEPGIYLVLRTSGGGDYIALLADQIMGPRARGARQQQQLWKARVRQTAESKFGMQSRAALTRAVAGELCRLGSLRANAPNVSYWMSAKCIRTQDIADFRALMEFAGLAGQCKELWAEMDFVDRAHRRAGHLIRKMLLREIRTSSLEQLQRDGYMEFCLEGQDGGSITALMIVKILPDIANVPASQIGTPFDVES